jgi:hypothetical protein
MSYDNQPDDDLNAFRGFIWGSIFGLVIWGMLIALVIAVYSQVR